MAKPKTNPHCPVLGCRTDHPHLASPTVAAMHQYFSKPDELAGWFKSSIVELIQSAIDDLKKGRFFAYLTRWRTPEELYYRALYILFVADEAAIPHVVSGELPNSFSAIWKAVDRKIFDGKGELDQPRSGLSGEQFTAMDTLNSSAHASFAAMMTGMELARNSEFRAPIIDQHIAYLKKMCDDLDQIEKLFKEGKSKEEVLTKFKQLRKSDAHSS
jgi:hypothetical protein